MARRDREHPEGIVKREARKRKLESMSKLERLDNKIKNLGYRKQTPANVKRYAELIKEREASEK